VPSRRPPSSPRHPVLCRGPNCDTPVWIKNVRPGHGGKLLRIPLEVQPSGAGTVAARPYTTEPGRFLARGEALAGGESRWVNHFDRCPDAASFRKPHAPKAGAPVHPALFTTEGTP
jgi:hypothetical protein